MKHRYPGSEPVGAGFKWGYWLNEIAFAVFILGLILLISAGCWVYLGLHGAVSLFVGLMGGLGLGIFMVLIAIREMETIEEQSGFDME
jgi:hypothetical protein